MQRARSARARISLARMKLSCSTYSPGSKARLDVLAAAPRRTNVDQSPRSIWNSDARQTQQGPVRVRARRKSRALAGCLRRRHAVLWPGDAARLASTRVQHVVVIMQEDCSRRGAVAVSESDFGFSQPSHKSAIRPLIRRRPVGKPIDTMSRIPSIGGMFEAGARLRPARGRPARGAWAPSSARWPGSAASCCSWAALVVG